MGAKTVGTVVAVSLSPAISKLGEKYPRTLLKPGSGSHERVSCNCPSQLLERGPGVKLTCCEGVNS